MVTFTTEQTLPFTFKVLDGRGRVVKVDERNGSPVATSSDETVATVTIAKATSGEVWNGVIDSVSASPADTTQRVTVTADADLGDGITEVVGFLDFTVTLDPLSGTRIAEMTAGAPVDKP